MRRKTKVWLIVAVSLILVGCLIVGGVMTMLKWDFTKLSTTKFVSNTHTVTEDFQNITVITDTADIAFVPSKDGNITVVCQEFEIMQHSVAVKDGGLVIEPEDTRKWYNYIGFHFGTPKITVTLPRDEYGLLTVKNRTGDVEIPDTFSFAGMDITESTGNVNAFASATGAVKIKSSTGDIRVENSTAGALELSVSTGRVTVSGVTCHGDFRLKVSTGKASIIDMKCKNLTSDGDTGGLTMKNVIAAEKFSLKRSTGNIQLDGCDAAEIFIETDTGNVTGSLLSEKVIFAKTDTGEVDVPKSVTGGKCEITTDTGNIKLTVK